MARPETAVVDASVVAKWFLSERDSEAALSLRDRHVGGEVRLVAPDLMIYEVANALRYHPAIGSDRLADHIGDVFALDIGLDPASETALTAAIRTAYRKGLSLTDASYIALADRINGVVYTADETLLRAAGPRGKHIRSLGVSG